MGFFIEGLPILQEGIIRLQLQYLGSQLADLLSQFEVVCALWKDISHTTACSNLLDISTEVSIFLS